jgi:hypothetical protein
MMAEVSIWPDLFRHAAMALQGFGLLHVTFIWILL